MLVNGDLVRVPQGSIVILEGSKSSISIVVEPEYAIVVETDFSNHEENVKILLNNKMVYTNKRNLQLVEAG